MLPEPLFVGVPSLILSSKAAVTTVSCALSKVPSVVGTYAVANEYDGNLGCDAGGACTGARNAAAHQRHQIYDSRAKKGAQEELGGGAWAPVPLFNCQCVRARQAHPYERPERPLQSPQPAVSLQWATATSRDITWRNRALAASTRVQQPAANIVCASILKYLIVYLGASSAIRSAEIVHIVGVEFY